MAASRQRANRHAVKDKRLPMHSRSKIIQRIAFQVLIVLPFVLLLAIWTVSYTWQGGVDYELSNNDVVVINDGKIVWIDNSYVYFVTAAANIRSQYTTNAVNRGGVTSNASVWSRTRPVGFGDAANSLFEKYSRYKIPWLVQESTAIGMSAVTILPILLSLAIASIAFFVVRGWRDFRRWRWQQSNRCIDCGYSRTGLTSDRCPECGSTFCDASMRRGWFLSLSAFGVIFVMSISVMATARLSNQNGSPAPNSQWRGRWIITPPAAMQNAEPVERGDFPLVDEVLRKRRMPADIIGPHMPTRQELGRG